MAQSLAFNADCMEAMRQFPDGFFDLAVVDPPYGDGSSQTVNVERAAAMEPLRPTLRPLQNSNNRGGWKHYQGANVKKPDGTWGYANWRRLVDEVRPNKKIISWDVAPKQEYFEELFRISRNQIIWGGNYFSLPPTRCFLIWRKLTISESFSMAMAEYAWTSFNSNAKVFEYAPQGQGDRFHPTQKPVALYAWIFKNYTQPGMKIIDTHLGSGSSRIAAYDAGLDFWGYEIDKTYFELQEERFEKHSAQMNLFLMD